MTALSIQQNPYLSNPEYSNFIALSRYARWLPELKRRETWNETVKRYFDYWIKKDKLDTKTVEELEPYVLEMKSMPSMRALMTAGLAADKDNTGFYNCSYTAVKRVTDFDEILYVLTVGTGVGFSCERQYVNQLPAIGKPLDRSVYAINETNFPGVAKDELSYIEGNVIYVADTKYGWASALRILIVELYNLNLTVGWDVTKVRKKGAPLVTFGGRASGPEPLVDLFKYCVNLFKSKVRINNEKDYEFVESDKLTSIDVHGLVCKIAEVVVIGGVEANK